jgi:hypothetical protein
MGPSQTPLLSATVMESVYQKEADDKSCHFIQWFQCQTRQARGGKLSWGSGYWYRFGADKSVGQLGKFMD